MSFATSDYRLEATTDTIRLSRGIVEVASKRYRYSPQQTARQGVDSMTHPKAAAMAAVPAPLAPSNDYVGWTAEYRLICTREPNGRDVYQLQRLRMVLCGGKQPEPVWVTVPTVDVPYTPEPETPTRGPL